MLITHITTSFRQLLANKGKSALTMLGVVIGIGSVIFIMTLGEVAKNFLLSQVTQFGTNVIEVAGSGEFGPLGDSDPVAITDDDIKELKDSNLLPEITALSAGYTTAKTAEYNGENYSLSIFGDWPDYFAINNYQLLAGRFFTESEVHNGAKVVVIGNTFAEDVFETYDNAVGKQISIDGTTFKIVGVVEEPAAMSGFIQQIIVYAPLTTVRRLYAPAEQQDEVIYILIEFAQGTDSVSFERRLKYELERITGAEEGTEPFLILSRTQFIEIFDTILLAIQLFVSAIAGISLFVGGIGIMNIMLVTVNERTKEIGLRKAVGAKNQSILIQFLIESIVLTTVGGIFGIIFGLGLSAFAVFAVNLALPAWDVSFVFVPLAPILACGVSITTGIIFGLYPALKASKLHPIESLRYE
ncbi:MAG: ABC transporter permease [bacterium]|nr:ABC transporter permease [bacterium]